jgi:hypothetical protein
MGWTRSWAIFWPLRSGAEVDHDHLDLAPIAGIDDAGQAVNAFEGDAALVPDETGVAGRNGDLDPRRHGEDLPRGEVAVDDGKEVEPGVAGVAGDGQLGFGVDALNLEFHGCHGASMPTSTK